MIFELIVLALFSSVNAAVATYGSESYITSAYDQYDMAETLTDLNQRRRDHGAEPLIVDLRLLHAASSHCEQLVIVDKLDHDDVSKCNRNNDNVKMEIHEKD